jgi:hypothetical protein
VRLAGLDPAPAAERGEVARLVFRPRSAVAAPVVRAASVIDAAFEGSAEIALPDERPGSPREGISGVGSRGPELLIRWALASPGALAELRVHDVAGRRVRTLVSGRLPAGTHETLWDGRDSGGTVVGAGVYFVRLEIGGSVWTRRAILVR